MEDPAMGYLANLLGLSEERHFRLSGTLAGIIGSVHALQLLLHIASSFRARTLVVWSREEVMNRFGDLVRRLTKKKTPIKNDVYHEHRTIKRTLSALESMLSAEGNYFVFGFVLRKAVEAGTQIFQCRHYSKLISRVWINDAFVGMVITNCWVTSLLNHLIISSDSRPLAQVVSIRDTDALTRASSIRERTLCVTVDALLTAISCLVLPLAIFLPWALKFDSDLLKFPDEVIYDDATFTRLVYENRAIFPLSFIDVFTKMVPHVSLLLGLTSVSLILEQHSPNLSCRRKATMKVIFVSPASKEQQSPGSITRKPSSKRRARTRLTQYVVTSTFLMAGVAVMALHFRANYLISHANDSIAQMCVQSVRPWLAQNVSCSVVKYNCYRQGVVTPPYYALDSLQREVLAVLIFEHCSAFKMPTSIRSFPSLLGLELWNVTLVDWGVDAALNAKLHPKMNYVIMVHVKMAALPAGVLQAPLPTLLGDIEIVRTNLTRIPDEVADVWSNVLTVFVEHTPLQEFPSALFRLPVDTISLVGDGFETLPDDLFTSVDYPSYYYALVLSYNPLQALPENVKRGMDIRLLLATDTNLTVIPSWAETVIDELLTLKGSPVCQHDGAELPNVVDCLDKLDLTNDGYYPLAFMESLRQI